MSVAFLIDYDQMPYKKLVEGRKDLYWLGVQRNAAHHLKEGLMHKEAEMVQVFSSFLLPPPFFLSGTPSPGMESLTLRVGLPSSENSLETASQGHSEVCPKCV